jgi:hypothetical protein
MVKVRIVTESETGETTEFEGESEEAYGEITQQESDQFTTPRYEITEAEIEGYEEIKDEHYEDYITDNFGVFEVGNLSFNSGRVVRELDPTAFRIGKSEYQENEQLNLQSEIEETVDYDDDNEEGFWDSVFRVLWD